MLSLFPPPVFSADVPPTGPMDLPLSLLEMGCSGRFELITHRIPGQSLPPQSTVSMVQGRVTFCDFFFFALTMFTSALFDARGKYVNK